MRLTPRQRASWLAHLFKAVTQQHHRELAPVLAPYIPADAVVLGTGWDETRWADAIAPSAGELDRAAGGRAVYLSRVDVHSAAVSSALVADVPEATGAVGYRANGLVDREAHHLLRSAAFAGDTGAFPTLFHKYYNPTGALAVRDAFTEPGVSSDVANNDVASGNFTSILSKAFSPSVLYDASIGRAILASTTTNAAGVRIIELRTSGDDLVTWPATAAATIDESPTNEVRYPSLIGDAPDPSAGALSPYLFYSHEPVATPTWPNTTLVVRRLQLTID